MTIEGKDLDKVEWLNTISLEDGRDNATNVASCLNKFKPQQQTLTSL